MNEQETVVKRRGRPAGVKNKVRAPVVEPKKKEGKVKAVAGTPGRPPVDESKSDKRSKELLYQLETKHKFDVVKELIAIYELDKKIYKPIMDKMVLGTQLSELDEERVDRLGKEMREILFRFLGYCYPKLKSTEIQGGTLDRFVFNVITGEEEKAKTPAQQIETPLINNILNIS